MAETLRAMEPARRSAPPIVALVPMRHHSERVPGKNFRLLAGRPLYSYVLEALLACSEISQVVVDTDSPVIMEGISAEFPAVRVIERPQHLRGGDVETNEVILHDIQVTAGEFYLQTHCTNPLVRSTTFSDAIRVFRERYPEHDSLFSVTRLQKRFWDIDGRPLNHDPGVLLRTQDLTPVYEENSCIYIFDRDGMQARRNRLGERPYLFPMEAEEAWDIDEEIDFQIAEFLMRRQVRAD
jgi:CMP-N-acetylneuraminic acid synthetase